VTTQKFLIAYAATALVFLALDALWLIAMADRLYRPALGQLMLERFDVAPAALFYAIYLAGVVVFAVAPALSGGRSATALGLGALLGLVAYGTYDLTNQATLRGWPWRITIADLCWGACATSAAAAVGARLTAWWTLPAHSDSRAPGLR
jgi:uncharacterized membrane protein